jgi:hypothetical protein
LAALNYVRLLRPESDAHRRFGRYSRRPHCHHRVACPHSRGCRFPHSPSRDTERRGSAPARVSGSPNAPTLVTPEAHRRVETTHAGGSEGLGRSLARRYARRPERGRGRACTSCRLQHTHGAHIWPPASWPPNGARSLRRSEGAPNESAHYLSVESEIDYAGAGRAHAFVSIGVERCP